MSLSRLVQTTTRTWSRCRSRGPSKLSGSSNSRSLNCPRCLSKREPRHSNHDNVASGRRVEAAAPRESVVLGVPLSQSQTYEHVDWSCDALPAQIVQIAERCRRLRRDRLSGSSPQVTWLKYPSRRWLAVGRLPGVP